MTSAMRLVLNVALLYSLFNCIAFCQESPHILTLPLSLVAVPGRPSRPRSLLRKGFSALEYSSVGSRLSRAQPFHENLRFARHVLVGKVRLGDGKTFDTLIDTGSGNLVVPSVDCRSTGCRSHQRFDPDDDDSGHFLGVDMSDLHLTFASGRLSGSGFEGKVCLGSACAQAGFVVAAWESDDFERLGFDGILGLGLPRQSAGVNFNIISMLAQQRSLPDPVFVLSLRSSGNSSITFGGYGTTSRFFGRAVSDNSSNASVTAVGNNTSITKPFWLGADSRHGEWAVPLSAVVVNGAVMDACGAHGCRAVLDSGCSTIALPAALFAQLHKHLPLRDCSPFALSLLPRLGFLVAANLTYDVQPKQYVEVSAEDPTQCRLLIQPLDDSSVRTAILGLPFLLDRDVVFDQGHMRVGISDFKVTSAPLQETQGSAVSHDNTTGITF